MPASSDPLAAQVRARIDATDNDGYKTTHAGYLDFDAFDNGRPEALLPALDARVADTRLSLLSMMLSGIYFGLLVGYWLMNMSSWGAIAGWAVPVGLVGLYAVITSRNLFRRLQRLHEAHALVDAMAQRRVASPE